MVAKIGDLAAAAAGRTDASDGLTAARDRGTELLAEAQRQADELLTAAQQQVAAADAAYATAWQAAHDAGWTDQTLTELGHQPPDGAPRRRRPTSRRAQPGTSPTAATAQPDQDDPATPAASPVA